MICASRLPQGVDEENLRSASSNNLPKTRNTGGELLVPDYTFDEAPSYARPNHGLLPPSPGSLLNRHGELAFEFMRARCIITAIDIAENTELVG
jgi:hypothetical protein